MTSEIGDTHVYFIRLVAKMLGSELNELNICVEIQQRVCVRKIHNVNGSTLWYDWQALSNASSITLDEWYKRL